MLPASAAAATVPATSILVASLAAPARPAEQTLFPAVAALVATKRVPLDSAISATHAPKATASALSLVPDRPVMQTALVASAEVAMHAAVALSVTAT